MNLTSLLSLAWRSLLSRRGAALLTVISVALSVALFLGVDKIRRGAEAGFGATISGTDVIVGARSGSINLLLYSVFRLGEAQASVSWDSFVRYSGHPDVAWTIPLSLGDSHRGYRVLGTNTDYFEHFRYGAKKAIVFAAGDVFADEHDAVLGAEVARALGYQMGDEIVIAHGVVEGFAHHDDHPFHVVGILAPTGTPIDRTVHVTLAGVEEMHAGFMGQADDGDRTPDQISAFLVGLNNRALAPRLLREVNTDQKEALTAIMPGLALAELWRVVGAANTAFTAIAAFVVATGLIGILIAILSSLNARRREIAVLRAAGARRKDIFSLLIFEAGLLALVGASIGAAVIYGALSVLKPWIETRFGIPLSAMGPSAYDAVIVATVVTASSVLGLIPASRAYKNSVSDGLSVKL